MSQHEVAVASKQSKAQALGIMQRKCDGCRKKKAKGLLQRRAVREDTMDVPPIVHEVLRSPGQPLDAATREFMEPRFGHDLSRIHTLSNDRISYSGLKIGPANSSYEQEAESLAESIMQMSYPGMPNGDVQRENYDFSKVQVHSDRKAVESARAVNALAYTVGHSIVLGDEHYAKGTGDYRQLMAHELTHVVQQRKMPNGSILNRQATTPAYRDCTPPITGIGDANERLESARQRAIEYIGAARSVLAAAPAPGTAYAIALNRHFITPNAADRATIRANYRQILGTLRISNYICNSQNICGREQAFWLPDDDLIHVCRPFWGLDPTCRAIILIHEGVHDVGIDPAAHPPNRGDPEYPAGNVAPPAGQTIADRMVNPDAYAFFAAHTWRGTDTGRTCF